MIDGLDIKHMRMFMQLVQERNVSKVAFQTGMSQQAVSAYLKRLRGFFLRKFFTEECRLRTNRLCNQFSR